MKQFTIYWNPNVFKKLKVSGSYLLGIRETPANETKMERGITTVTICTVNEKEHR